MNNKWVLEYSVSQDCFNVDTKERILQKNRLAMYEQMSNDYKIIGEFETEDEAFEMGNILRRKVGSKKTIFERFIDED
jgi:hypothetical protein